MSALRQHGPMPAHDLAMVIYFDLSMPPRPSPYLAPRQRVTASNLSAIRRTLARLKRRRLIYVCGKVGRLKLYDRRFGPIPRSLRRFQ